MTKPSWVLVGVGLALAFAGTLFFKLRGAEKLSRGTLAADGVCRAPLGIYCDDKALPLPLRSATNACPGYSQALEAAKVHEPLLEAEAGTCGELKWVKWSTGFDGETSYFGAKDELVSVEAWADYRPYCASKSGAIVYGARADCQHHTTTTIRSRPGTAPTPAPR